MIRTENTKRTLERKFWSSGWISLWVLAYSYERHWYLFSLFLRQKKVFVCFASICTISPCLKFLQGFYWKKKKSVLTSTLLYCSKSMQHSARSSWVSELQIGICFIIYSLTSQRVWLWKKKPPPFTITITFEYEMTEEHRKHSSPVITAKRWIPSWSLGNRQLYMH